MNIVDLISSQLSSNVLSQLGGLVGGSEQQMSSASKAAVPALLQVFAKLASSRSGADKLAGAMGGLDLSKLSDLAGLLGGGNASGLGNIGGELLGSLLGGSNLTKLIGTLASFVGSQPDLMKKLLPYLAPIVLGLVAKQFSGKADATSVSRLFSEQAGNISSALPKGLSLGDLGSLLPSGGSSPKHDTAPSGSPSWLLPLLALAAIGVGAYLLYQNRAPQQGDGQEVVIVSEEKEGPLTLDRTEVISEQGNSLVDTVQEVLSIDPKFLEAVRVGKNVTELFGGLTSVLGGVTNEETARAAIPELEALAPMLGAIETEAGNLPADEQPAFAEFIGKNLGMLQKVIDVAMAIPGVKDLLGPVVAPMVESLTKLAK
jgi:hypothetical protein